MLQGDLKFMEEEVNEKLNNLCENDMNKVLNIFNRESKEIKISSDPAVVIVGNLQTGKSTLINSMLGFEFEKVKEGRERILRIKEESLREMAKKNIKPLSIGNGRTAETMFPGRYKNDIISYSLIDTRGYHDNTLDTCSVIASSLLVDAYLNKTNKVILTFINKFNNYSSAKDTFDMMEFVNNFSPQSIKMYFIANRYSSEDHDDMYDYKQLKDEEFNEVMDEKLRSSFVSYYKDQIKIILKAIDSTPEGKKLNIKYEDFESKDNREIAEKILQLRESIINGEEGTRNNDLREGFEKLKFLSILKAQCDEKRMIYFEPLRKVSVQRIRDIFADPSKRQTRIEQIPPYLPPNIITLSSTINECKKFLDYVQEKASVYTYLLQAYLTIIHIPDGLEDAVEGYNMMIKEIDNRIKILNDNKGKDKDSEKERENFIKECEEKLVELDRIIQINEKKKKEEEEQIGKSRRSNLSKYKEPATFRNDESNVKNECNVDRNFPIDIEKFVFVPGNEDTFQEKGFLTSDKRTFHGHYVCPGKLKAARNYLIRGLTLGLSSHFYSPYPCEGTIYFYAKYCNLPQVVIERSVLENDIVSIDVEIDNCKQKKIKTEQLKKEENEIIRKTEEKKNYEKNIERLKKAMDFKNKCTNIFNQYSSLIDSMVLFIKKLELNKSENNSFYISNLSYSGLYSTIASSSFSSSSSSSSSSPTSSSSENTFSINNNTEEITDNNKIECYDKFLKIKNDIEEYTRKKEDMKKRETKSLDVKEKAKKIFKEVNTMFTNINSAEHRLDLFDSEENKEKSKHPNSKEDQ